ncbi:hypothetical protein [Rhodococcus sp. MALMAid1271]|uniref:hypothetical protein n=1 Tax=Rhodococcus sp. MALMAid1271 TaxID=3411744 RepID=UPI003B9DFBF4
MGRAGAVIGTVALCAVALVSGCSSSPARDATGTDPAAHASSPSAPPPGFGETALWSIPFLSQPHIVEDGFVGVVDSSDASGSHRVQVLDDTGTPRFGVDVPADRDEFMVTGTDNRELLITEDIDDSGSGSPATMTARDTRTGDLVWGPVSAAGCLTGSGLLIDADCSQTAMPSAVAAISATDGHRTDLSGAVSESGGYAVTVYDDTARVVTVDTGNTAWSTDTLTPPPAAVPGSARFVATAGNAVVVAWTIPTRPEPIQAVYRLSDAELRWISGSRSPMVVTADSSSGATMITTADLTDDGIAVLFEQYGTRGFTADQFPGADRFALVGGVVYGASDSGVTAIDATSGRVTGTSPSAAPTAVTSNGVALAQSSDGYTAFKVIPHF